MPKNVPQDELAGISSILEGVMTPFAKAQEVTDQEATKRTGILACVADKGNLRTLGHCGHGRNVSSSIVVSGGCLSHSGQPRRRPPMDQDGLSIKWLKCVRCRSLGRSATVILTEKNGHPNAAKRHEVNREEGNAPGV